MSSIPTQKENPAGLHQRYYIQKIVRHQPSFMGLPVAEEELILQDVDPGAEYFVMRLDEGGSDINHIKACRIGIHAYADAIYPFIPELAIDLRKRYPLL